MKTHLTIRHNPAREGMTDYLAAVMHEKQKAGQDPYQAVMLLHRQEGKDAFTEVISGALDSLQAEKQENTQEKARRIYRSGAYAHCKALEYAQKNQWLSMKGINDLLVSDCGLRDGEVTAAWDVFRELEKHAAEKRAQATAQYAQSSAVGV